MIAFVIRERVVTTSLLGFSCHGSSLCGVSFEVVYIASLVASGVVDNRDTRGWMRRCCQQLRTIVKICFMLHFAGWMVGQSVVREERRVAPCTITDTVIHHDSVFIVSELPE